MRYAISRTSIAIAGAGYGHVPKILTFVIGVGSSLGALNGIAMAGGTNQAFIVDTNANVNQQFLDAMNKIRGAALSCEYIIPTPDAGMLGLRQGQRAVHAGRRRQAGDLPRGRRQGALPDGLGRLVLR